MDPSYPYLLSSLLVAEGRLPAQIAHPGLTLEALGALALRVTHLVRGKGILRDQVLLDPEAFLGGIQIWLLVLLAAASLFLGWAVRSFTGSTLCVVAAQLVPLCSQCMATTFRVMCEPLGLSIALVLAGLACLELRERRAGPRVHALMGVAAALCIATKVSFAPLALLPLVVLDHRQRKAFVAWFAVALALFLAPVAPRLVEILAWYARLAGHTGPYGGGPAGLVEVPGFGRSLLTLFAAEPIAHAVGLLAFLLLAARRQWIGEPGARMKRVLWTILGVQCGVLILSARQAPLKLYYLMPGVALSGLALALMHRLVPDHGRWRTGWTGLLCLISTSSVVFQARVQATMFQERRWELDSVRAAGKAASRYPHEHLVHGPVVPCIHSALQFGNSFCDNAFSQDLRRLYPRLVFLDRGMRAFGDPIGFRRMRALAEPDGSFVVWESTFFPLEAADWITNPRTEPIGGFGEHRLTRVRAEPLLAASPREAPASPPFAGVIALEQDDLWRPVPGQFERIAADPPGRFLLTGSGGPMWLVGEARYAGSEPQLLRFLFESREALRIDMAPGSRQSFVVPLQTVRGLNALTIDYSSAVDLGPWPPLGSVPGTGVGLSRKKVTGVVFLRLQLCGPGV
jgi:hypothetical protein